MKLHSWLVSASASVVQTGSILLVFLSPQAPPPKLFYIVCTVWLLLGKVNLGIFFFLKSSPFFHPWLFNTVASVGHTGAVSVSEAAAEVNREVIEFIQRRERRQTKQRGTHPRWQILLQIGFWKCWFWKFLGDEIIQHPTCFDTTLVLCKAHYVNWALVNILKISSSGRSIIICNNYVEKPSRLQWLCSHLGKHTDGCLIQIVSQVMLHSRIIIFQRRDPYECAMFSLLKRHTQKDHTTQHSILNLTNTGVWTLLPAGRNPVCVEGQMLAEIHKLPGPKVWVLSS